MSAATAETTAPQIDTCGLCLGQPHPLLRDVEKLARHFAVEVWAGDHEEKKWVFRGMNGQVEYFPEKRKVQLTYPPRRAWAGNREGDYAIAIMVAITGLSPVFDNNGYTLCNTIRSYAPPSE